MLDMQTFIQAPKEIKEKVLLYEVSNLLSEGVEAKKITSYLCEFVEAIAENLKTLVSD